MSVRAIESQFDDHPLQTIVLERVEDEAESHVDATAELLAAADMLARGWLVPLGLGFFVDCCDPDNYMTASSSERPALWSWFLRVAQLPIEIAIRAPFADAHERIGELLDRETIARAVNEATAQPCGAGHVAMLSRLRWTMVRAAMPVDEDVTFMDGRDLVDVPQRVIDGVRWALGPTRVRAGAPIELELAYEQGAMRLKLYLYCDLWLDYPTLVDDAIARVLARPGWECRK